MVRTDRQLIAGPISSWASTEHSRRVMVGNRGRDTRPELRLRSELHARGLRFRVSIRPVTAVRRTADIVFTRRRVAVFVDGCYWHGCPLHYKPAKTNADYWSSKIAANVARDQDTNEQMEAAGWLVVRVWEHEQVSGCADEIERIVRSR